MSRYALLLRMHDDGCNVAELAEWFELSPRWVRDVLRELRA